MEIKIDKEFHALIPELRPEELAGLKESILAEGCRDALIVWGEYGILLDGHNRYQICTENRLAFKTLEIELLDRDMATEWIIRNQLARRNLRAWQRWELIEHLKPIIAARSEKRMLAGKVDPVLNSGQGRTDRELAKRSGLGHDTVARCGVITKELAEYPDPKMVRSLNSGEMSIHAAHKEIRRRQKRRAPELDPMPFPSGKYRILYADPPWEYGSKNLTDYGHAHGHYKTMSIKELCDLEVEEIATDDAVLFLWVTSPLLDQAFKVIHAWGFTYKASFVWDKVLHNFGHYNSVRHEFLLVCTRGSCLPDSRKLTDSVQTIERTHTHSEKPEAFRQIIDAAYGKGPRIELFARKQVDGWESWGNRAE